MIDNKRSGTIADELRENIRKDSKLSIMTAYFTIYAFEALKKELMKVDSVRLMFTDPTFLREKQELSREYYIENGIEQALHAISMK